jgi:hypothetical protein
LIGRLITDITSTACSYSALPFKINITLSHQTSWTLQITACKL